MIRAPEQKQITSLTTDQIIFVCSLKKGERDRIAAVLLELISSKKESGLKKLTDGVLALSFSSEDDKYAETIKIATIKLKEMAAKNSQLKENLQKIVQNGQGKDASENQVFAAGAVVGIFPEFYIKPEQSHTSELRM